MGESRDSAEVRDGKRKKAALSSKRKAQEGIGQQQHKKLCGESAERRDGACQKAGIGKRSKAENKGEVKVRRERRGRRADVQSEKEKRN
ncbi:hypothetical protein ACFX19_037515 [Malus domestica]